MIDNPHEAARLLAELRAALPLLAAFTPESAALVREQWPGRDVPHQCPITGAHYAGDEGGIMCKVDVGGSDRPGVVHVSITHLRFARAAPLARAVAAYQKHRVKRLRRLGGSMGPDPGHRRG